MKCIAGIILLFLNGLLGYKSNSVAPLMWQSICRAGRCLQRTSGKKKKEQVTRQGHICQAPSWPLSPVVPQGFKTHQCKNMKWAVYSPMGLPSLCHQSNVVHITVYHCCNKDGPCMNMSGVPKTFMHCPSSYITFIHSTSMIRGMAPIVGLSVTSAQTLFFCIAKKFVQILLILILSSNKADWFWSPSVPKS